MSIYGSLKAGVTGLKAQASSMAMISDNIANANTVGYKRSVADFETLVTQSGSSATYAPGGVSANTVQKIDQQGLINASSSTTDVAIAGRGFFAVSRGVNSNGTIPFGTERLFTRAGSFTTNSEGFLTSSSGEYLLGIAADAQGNVPTATKPVDQLTAISVGAITGSAKATSTVSIGANLPATATPPSNNYTINLAAGSEVNFAAAAATVVNFPIATTVAASPAPTPAVAGLINPASDASIDPPTAANLYTGDVRFTKNGTGGYDVSLSLNANAGPPAFAATSVLLGTMTAAGTLNYNATVAVPGGQLSIKIGGSVANNAAPAAPVATVATLVDRSRLRMTDSTGTASNSTSSQLDLSTTGGIQSGYTSGMTLYDSLGVGHNIDLAYVKTGTNTWSVYVTRMTIVGRTDANGNPIDSISGGTINSWVYNGAGTDAEVPDLAANAAVGKLKPSSRLGNLTFNTDGSLAGFTANDTTTATNTAARFGFPSAAGVPLNTSTSTGATAFNPTLNFGTVGTKNGLTQQSDGFAVSFVNQDGVKFGYKTGVAIDKDGVVRAVFDNGQRLAVARIPITTFADANKLQSRSGNLYAQTDVSGSPTTNFSGIGGAGQVQGNALEGSTVDLAEEFTDMIVTQRNYSANSRTITTSDEMLQEIINLKR